MKMTPTVSEDVREMLENVIKEDIKNFHISVNYPNKKGDGFLGEICFLNLKEKNGEKNLNFVIKSAFTTEQIRNIHPIRSIYQNEIFFYEKVWASYQKFQLEYSVMKPFDKIPKYFASSLENSAEKLVLENLKFSNFELFNKKKAVDRDHMELIFKVYGKFHAMSFAYKEVNGEGFEELSKNLIDIWDEFGKNTMFPTTIKITTEAGLKALCPGKDDKIIDAYKDYVEHGFDKYLEGNRYKGRYSVILHGDGWINNMMFKYNDARKPVDLRLLDFQCTKSGTPVFDLSYSLYTGASKEILDNLEFYLKLYHNSLSETIKNFGLDPEKLYPFYELKSDWKQYCKFGFIMALIIWKIKFTYDDHIVDLTDFANDDGDDNALVKAKFDKKAYNAKARDLIIHMYENNFL